MAAPAGVGSGSAPEPVISEADVPELDATEADATEADAPAADAPAADATEADAPAADAPAAEQSGPAADENAAAGLAEYEPAAGERRRVSWLVVVGVIVVLVAVAAAAVVLVVATHGSRHKTVVTYRPAAVFSLRAGECLNSSQNGLSVTILSCATPHAAEVFATFSLTGSSWPGEAAVQQQVSNGCTNRLAGYLNPQLLNAGLTQQYVYPDQQAWQAGVRTVVCEVSSASGPLSGSVRNGG